MIKTIIASTVSSETTSNIIGETINSDVSGVISKLVASDITFTIITTLVGIVAGAAFSFPKRFWRNFTFIVSAIVFDLYLFSRWVFTSGNKYEFWYQNIEFWIFVVSALVSIGLCVLGILCSHQKEIVSRDKIGKMIRKFTDRADPNQPVCIFAGDINFFGDVIKSESDKSDEDDKSGKKAIDNSEKIKKRKINLRKKTNETKEDNNIKENDQYKQLYDLKCRNICVLCIKPLAQAQDMDGHYKADRVRIGFLASQFGNSIRFRFIDDKCHACQSYNQIDCEMLQCEKCKPSDSCPKANNQHVLPDTTLRGRIVTSRETGAKCVAITTKRSSGKDYILRQYGAGEKESSLYDVIWKVWWSRCPEDLTFISDCKDEYKQFIGKSGDNI